MHTVTDVACPVCGCVCDDLELTVDKASVVSVKRACHLAEPWFLGQSSAKKTIAQVAGEAVPLDSAIQSAARILQQAKAPLVYGLSRSSSPGQRAAIDLAELLCGTVDTTASMCHGPSIMALQSVGESTCSLGEIRNRSDLVIFWGCNPAVSHPRHAERYSVFPSGQFVPRGRADRTIVMIGDRRDVDEWRLDPAGSVPDMVIPIESSCDFEAITMLRGMLKGIPFDESNLDVSQTGASLTDLKRLVELMRSCRSGVVFFGLGLTGTELGQAGAKSELGHHNVEVLLRLVTELNGVTRFYARRMRIQGDVSGADSVLCWRTGFPFSVNLSRRFPRYNPGEYSANSLLERNEVDACLLVGSETVPFFSPEARARLESIPTIALDYPSTQPGFVPSVQFTTAPYGLFASGTIYRMDEVPLPLRSSLSSSLPTDEDVLRGILAEIGGSRGA